MPRARPIEIGGRVASIRAHARDLGITTGALQSALKRGEDPRAAAARLLRGEKLPPRRKLTAEQVVEIRHACAAGVTQVELQRRYGVSEATISHVVTGRAWAWVGGQTLSPRRMTGRTMTSRREYVSWSAMKARCLNPADPQFRNYGARGIVVCPQWSGADGFATFLRDMGERPEGTSLDRIDVNGNYEPGNCRWADAKTQANNRRTVVELQEEVDALRAEVARLRAAVTRVERRQRGEDPRQLRLVR